MGLRCENGERAAGSGHHRTVGWFGPEVGTTTIARGITAHGQLP